MISPVRGLTSSRGPHQPLARMTGSSVWMNHFSLFPSFSIVRIASCKSRSTSSLAQLATVKAVAWASFHMLCQSNETRRPLRR